MATHVVRAALTPFCRRQIFHFLSPQTTTKTTTPHHLTLFSPPHSLSLSSNHHNRYTNTVPPRGLRLPRETERDEDEKKDETIAEKKRRNRNEMKREARRAVRLGMELASFTTPQIKRILKAASLEPEVFEALMLVKRLGSDVREGKRRQFNYIGKLLRDAQPDLLVALIEATKEGDHSRIQALAGSVEPIDEAAEEEFHESESEVEVEDSGEHLVLASKWYEGLINKDIEISNEVYSVDGVEFDHQELRRLVRKVHYVQERQNSSEEDSSAKLTAAKKTLNQFLCSLAKCLSASKTQNILESHFLEEYSLYDMEPHRSTS